MQHEEATVLSLAISGHSETDRESHLWLKTLRQVVKPLSASVSICIK